MPIPPPKHRALVLHPRLVNELENAAAMFGSVPVEQRAQLLEIARAASRAMQVMSEYGPPMRILGDRRAAALPSPLSLSDALLVYAIESTWLRDEQAYGFWYRSGSGPERG